MPLSAASYELSPRSDSTQPTPLEPPKLNLESSPLTDSFDSGLHARAIEVIKLKGRVVHGFGRGAKSLGCPTANLDSTAYENGEIENLKDGGVYIGFVAIDHSSAVYKCVLSIGVNPTFDDSIHKTVEVHILHNFESDFYGSFMKLLICGKLRDQHKFHSLQELIKWIERDCRVALKELDSPQFKQYENDSLFET